MLTAFATYFGVIQRDRQTLPHFISVLGNADRIRSTVYKPELVIAASMSTSEKLDIFICFNFHMSAYTSLCLPITVDQTCSRNSDKIQRAERVQQRRLDCLSLVCSQEVNGAIHTHYVKLAKSTLTSSLCLRQGVCCQLRSKG